MLRKRNLLIWLATATLCLATVTPAMANGGTDEQGTGSEEDQRSGSGGKGHCLAFCQMLSIEVHESENPGEPTASPTCCCPWQDVIECPRPIVGEQECPICIDLTTK